MKKLVFNTLLFFSLIFSSVLHAKDFGTYGDVYPVKEPSFIESLQSKIKEMVDNGEWEKHKKKYIDETMGAFKRPAGHELPHATTSSSRLYDPSIVLQMDIQLADGKYLARRGDYINPLEQTNMNNPIAMIDGDDEKQVAWAIKMREKEPKTKIILVNGNWYDLSVKHKFQFFFDQTGEFINRLDIKKTPSYISQQGLRLKIDEVAL